MYPVGYAVYVTLGATKMQQITKFLLPWLVVTASLAEGMSTFEFMAFQDASIALCSANEPEKAKLFEKLRDPPYACAPYDESIARQARKSTEYRAVHLKVLRQMESATKEQRLQFCQSLMTSKCGA